MTLFSQVNVAMFVVTCNKDYCYIGSISFISSSGDRCHVYNEQVWNGMNEISVLCW